MSAAVRCANIRRHLSRAVIVAIATTAGVGLLQVASLASPAPDAELDPPPSTFAVTGVHYEMRGPDPSSDVATLSGLSFALQATDEVLRVTAWFNEPTVTDAELYPCVPTNSHRWRCAPVRQLDEVTLLAAERLYVEVLTPLGTQVVTPPDGPTPPSTVGHTPPTTDVLGTKEGDDTPPTGPGTRPEGGRLPFTGTVIGQLSLWGILVLAAGAVLLVRRRRSSAAGS